MTPENNDLEYLVHKDIEKVDTDLVITDAMDNVKMFQQAYTQALDYYNKLEKAITTPGIEVRSYYDPNEDVFFYEQVIKK